jgi:hypothetical protein
MQAVELVAVAHQNECGNTFHPAPEQANDVERRFVGPMDVFDRSTTGACLPSSRISALATS